MPNTIKDSFELITAEDSLKESTKRFVTQKYAVNGKKRSLHRRLAVSATACVLALILGVVGYAVYFTPVSVISIDVNSSVELAVNRFDTVIGTSAYNDEGKELLSRINVRFKNYNEAVNRVLSDESIEAYIKDEQVVCITVIDENEAKRKNMVDKLCNKSEASSIYVESGNRKDVEHAHESGMSYGKYKAYLKAKSENVNLTEEEAAKLSMREMYDMIGHGKGEHGQNKPEGGNRHEGFGNEESHDKQHGKDAQGK